MGDDPDNSVVIGDKLYFGVQFEDGRFTVESVHLEQLKQTLYSKFINDEDIWE